ncbi:MAG: hypothetical protein U0Q22_08030 [Acidimicrobiales bacterium]
MISSGLLVRMIAAPGREAEAEELLVAVLRIAERETQTEASFLLRFGVGVFATLDLFLDDMARREHLAGAAAQAIHYRSRDLFAPPPTQTLVDVVAHDLPAPHLLGGLTDGAMLSFGAGWADDLADLTTSGNDDDPPSGWVALGAEDGAITVVELAAGDPAAAHRPSPWTLHAPRLLAREDFTLVGGSTITLPADDRTAFTNR